MMVCSNSHHTKVLLTCSRHRANSLSGFSEQTSRQMPDCKARGYLEAMSPASKQRVAGWISIYPAVLGANSQRHKAS